MTLQSLQKIISLENELYAAEQVEQEKASAWLQEQQEEILRQHGMELAALEEKKAEVRARAADEANQKADEMVHGARDRAGFLDRLEDSVLRQHLEKTLKFIVGKAP
jgi:hypothetical protein